MQTINSEQYHSTSVSLRKVSRRRFWAALKILRRNGVPWSESELLRRLAKLYLRHWRGRGVKSATARRYNREFAGEKYVRVAWYVDRVLYAVLWERSVHTGESISRQLDFAIRHYMPRLLEEFLSSPMPGSARARRNHTYWRNRLEKRPHPQPDVFITYECCTAENSHSALRYAQEYRIYRKNELSSGDILYLLRRAS